MPKYMVRATATATIEEHWLVEAPNEEAAKNVVYGDDGEGGKILVVTDNTLGDEQDRDVCGIMRMPDDYEHDPKPTVSDLCGELRSMGCAVTVLTAEDIQNCGPHDDNDEPLVSLEQADEWLRFHRRDVEEAILGDYWGETVRAVMDFHPIGRETTDA